MYFDSSGGATALLQLCSGGLRDNAGALAEFELSEHILLHIVVIVAAVGQVI